MRAGRPEAAAEIWPWREAHSQADALERTRAARRRGSAQAAIGLLAGACLYLFWREIPGLVALAVASLLLAIVWISPTRGFPAIERAVAAFGRAVGNALSWILMPVLFVGIFLPFGLLLRRGKRDPLRRFFEADASSYWRTRDPASEVDRSYERPF